MESLTRDFFNMCVNDLCVFIRVFMKRKELDKYYEKYKYLTNKRFAEAVEYIKDNHEYPGSFPLPAEFNHAIRMTVRENTYIPMTREGEDKEETSQFFKDLKQKFPPIGNDIFD